MELTGFFDMVSAELDVSGNEYLPRIPPSRAGIGLQFDLGGFSANLDYVRASKQDSVADYEFPTEGYEDLRVYLSYEIETGKRLTEVYLRGRNLTGDEQRKHTSIIKDLAPDPSRTIEAGVRFPFLSSCLPVQPRQVVSRLDLRCSGGGKLPLGANRPFWMVAEEGKMNRSFLSLALAGATVLVLTGLGAPTLSAQEAQGSRGGRSTRGDHRHGPQTRRVAARDSGIGVRHLGI